MAMATVVLKSWAGLKKKVTTGDSKGHGGRNGGHNGGIVVANGWWQRAPN